MEISVVIPCLNEEANIKECIKKCLNSFAKLNVEGEVIVVDNNSTDNTAEVAEQSGAKVVKCEKAGYGFALRSGFEIAKGKYIIMGDGDDTYDFNEIPTFYEKIKSSEADMVTGARLGLKGSKIEEGAMPFLHRYLGTPVLTFILNILYRVNISDINCGMRMFKKECIDSINFQTGGMEFASELFVQFAKHKFKIVEIPIVLHLTRGVRDPKLNTLKDGFRHLFYLISALIK